MTRPMSQGKAGCQLRRLAGPLGEVIVPVMSVQVSSFPDRALRGHGGATSEGCDGKGAPGQGGHQPCGWSAVVSTGDTTQLRGEGGRRRKQCLVL